MSVWQVTRSGQFERKRKSPAYAGEKPVFFGKKSHVSKIKKSVNRESVTGKLVAGKLVTGGTS